MKHTNRLYERFIAADQEAKEKEYWLSNLSGEWDASHFPYDYKVSLTDYQVKKMTFAMPEKLCRRLIEVSDGSLPTLHVIFIAAAAALLNRYTGSRDIVVGTPIYKQAVEGEFINTILFLRNRLTEAITFRELLHQVKDSVLEAVAHQDYPLELLRERLNLPWFDVVVLLKNIHDKRYIEHIRPNMIFSFRQKHETIESEVEYNRLRYSESTIERIISHFTSLLEQGLFNTDIPVSLLDILSVKQKKQILVEFNETALEYPQEKTIQELFAQQVQKNPHYLALTAENPETGCNLSFTYDRLNRETNQLAGILKERGVKPGDMVALLMDRSPDMINGIMGILKAGAAYVPIDTRSPKARILYMLEDCNASLLLTKSEIIKNHSFYDLQGISQHLTGQDICITGTRPNITNLDQLPFPNRSLVNYEKYHGFIGQSLIKNTISMLGSRGCPFHCAYCHKIWPKKHITRSAENIFQEIQLFSSMGVRRFVFLDDVFNLDVKNTTGLFQLIIKNKLDIQLSLCLRGDILTKDYIDLMVKAGTLRMALALETASPRLQKLIGKNLNLEKFRKNIRYICERFPQVILEINTMHGFPTETRAEALMTLEFIKSLKWIHFPYVNILKIYQNTAMVKLAMESGVSAESIAASAGLAYHELPDTLPFDKSFTLKYQAEFLNEYFLAKERLRDVLPYQARALTEDELVQKYNSYLPVNITCFNDILEFTGISRQELEKGGSMDFLSEAQTAVLDFNKKLKHHFKHQPPARNALRILLLDLSQLFRGEDEDEIMLYDVVEPPLGLMYILTYLQRQFGNQIAGKIAKSRIDFENYDTLKALLEEFHPQVIGFRTLTFYRDFFHRTTTMIRNWGIEVPIIAGGPYATSDYQTLLADPNVNLAVLGEGEITFSQLIREMLKNNGKLPGERVLKQIKGLAFQDSKEKRKLARHVFMTDVQYPALAKEAGLHCPPINQPTHPAYTIYTSGSTGQPKGVMVEHRNVTNLVTGLNERIYKRYSSPQRVTLVSHYGFDASVKQIFAALLLGHSLYIVPEHTRTDGVALLQYYQKHQIDISDGTPAHLLLLLESIKHHPLRIELKHFIIGGEVLPRHLVKDFIQAFEPHPPIITNVYGPTECCVDATSYDITEENLNHPGEIPIGSPMPNYQVYILDSVLHLQPMGAVSELCIAGAGVGRGYLNNPELTAEKFGRAVILHSSFVIRKFKRAVNSNLSLVISSPSKIITNVRCPMSNDRSHSNTPSPCTPYSPHSPHSPHSPYSTIYKTGDLARWLDDGNIEFIGRTDSQVKIRGFRIELGEIENRLVAQPGIKQAAVIAQKINEERCLCAYVVAHKEIDTSEIKAGLSDTLPEYMIPLYFLQLEKMPLNPNGKIDRKALPALTLEAGDKYTPPGNDIERKMVKIWSDILSRDPSHASQLRLSLGIDANFFQLGGHSLKANILALKIHKELKVEVPLAEIFLTPTIRGLAKYIKAAPGMQYSAIQPTEQKEYYMLSSAQKRLFIQLYTQKNDVSYNTPHTVLLEGNLNKEKLEKIFYRLMRRHENLRTSFEMTGEQPIQKIHQHVDFVLEYHEGMETEVEELVKNFVQPFDLTNVPLLRVRLVKLLHTPTALRSHPRRGTYNSQEGKKGRYLLMVDMHHIITDGTSVGIMVKELMALYAGEVLPPLRLQYKDISEWQNKNREIQVLKKQEAYWLKEFEHAVPKLNLPTDYVRPETLSHEGSTAGFELDRKKSRLLNHIASEEGATLYILLLAIFSVLLSKECDQEDILIGVPIAGRRHADLDQLIGFFVNMLALRNFPKEEKTFREFLLEVKEKTLNAYDNQDYQFEDLVDNLLFDREANRHSLIDAVFVFQNVEMPAGEIPELEIPGLRLIPHESPVNFSPFDLILHGYEADEKLIFSFQYKTALFKEETIQMFIRNFKEVVSSVLENKTIQLKDIDISDDLLMVKSNTLDQDRGDFDFLEK